MAIFRMKRASFLRTMKFPKIFFLEFYSMIDLLSISTRENYQLLGGIIHLLPSRYFTRLTVHSWQIVQVTCFIVELSWENDEREKSHRIINEVINEFSSQESLSQQLATTDRSYGIRSIFIKWMTTLNVVQFH